MTKNEWDELQAQFLADNARTGIKLKEWCEARGIEFNSARRYIKTKAAQSAQKSAQKKVRTAQKEKCAEELVDDDGLTGQQRLFIAEYLKDSNATQAAIRAGYSKKSAEQIGYQLLQKTSVAQIIAQQQKASIVQHAGQRG
nr:MAG TPA: Terminase small subunit [Caudoviricetes sp.]